MKNYLKYFIILFITVLSGIIISSIPKNPTTTPTVIKDTIAVKKPVIKVDFYSEKSTKKVTHKLDSLLKRINKRHDFHGSILVAKNGKVVYQNHIGLADFRKKEPLHKKSVYQLASVSKQFTATAILMLMEKKLLKLNDTVTKYFPKFPFADITIQHLLNHTSGLPNYFWVAENEWKEKHPPSNLEMMTFLANSSTALMFFRPGKIFDYSNTGYFVLASIVEKISNTSYSKFLETNIFKPLQMDNSYVYSFKKDTIRKGQLDGYRLYRGWRHLKIRGTINDAVVGDKNIYATPLDLLKWVNGLNSGKLISKESLELMYAKGKTKYGRKIPYGFGFRIKENNSEKVIYHFGKWNGFSTGISQYPDNLTIIVLEHTSYGSTGTLTKKVRKIVDKNFNL